ncbi:MAG: zinc-binding dehydrogenase [Candidatus Brocadiaceae bacterium]
MKSWGVGDGVKRFKVGDRVTVAHHVPCNTCHYCLNGHYSVCETLRTTNFYPGGFAEYLRIPPSMLIAALLSCQMKFLMKKVLLQSLWLVPSLGQRKAGIRPGHSILVIGSGISGLLHILLARALGAGKIFAVDITEYRLNMAKQCGADAAFHAKEDVPAHIRKHNDGRLADMVIVCTGAPSAIDQALKSVDRGGAILFLPPRNPM